MRDWKRWSWVGSILGMGASQRASESASRRVGRERSKVSHPKFVVDRHLEANGCATRQPSHARRPHDKRAARAAFNGRQLKGKSLRVLTRGSRIQVHPEQACIALRAHERREAFFPLGADFTFRVTLQQPKFLCSSQLGETCPCSTRRRRRRALRSHAKGKGRRFLLAYSETESFLRNASGTSGSRVKQPKTIKSIATRA